MILAREERGEEYGGKATLTEGMKYITGR